MINRATATGYPGVRCRRLLQRLDLADLGLPARVGVAGRALDGIVLNISLGGCAVRIETGMPGPDAFPGCAVSVTLPRVATAGRTPLVCDAELVELEDGVMRVRFYPLSLQGRHALTRFLNGLPRARLLRQRSV